MAASVWPRPRSARPPSRGSLEPDSKPTLFRKSPWRHFGETRHHTCSTQPHRRLDLWNVGFHAPRSSCAARVIAPEQELANVVSSLTTSTRGKDRGFPVCRNPIAGARPAPHLGGVVWREVYLVRTSRERASERQVRDWTAPSARNTGTTALKCTRPNRNHESPFLSGPSPTTAAMRAVSWFRNSSGFFHTM